MQVKIWKEKVDGNRVNNVLIGKEKLTKQALIDQFRKTVYLDVLPYYYPLKDIQDFKTFARFMLFPFFGIQVEKRNRLTVKKNDEKFLTSNDEDDHSEEESEEEEVHNFIFWQQAQGLLNLIEKNFLSEKCKIFLHNLIYDEFRLVIHGSYNAIRVDLKFDFTSFNKYFELVDGEELVDLEQQDMIKFVEMLDMLEDNKTEMSSMDKKKL